MFVLKRGHDHPGSVSSATLSVSIKHDYIDCVSVYWRKEFPRLPSYQRCVEWMPSTLIPLCVYLTHCFGRCSGISFINATSLKDCHNRRISQHRVFNHLVARGKTSVDWFSCLKLHLVVNELGELLNLQITPGNTDERKPVINLLQSLCGKVFADRPQLSLRSPPRSFDIEHSCHRSPVNFAVNVLCGLIAYYHQPKKPSLHLEWALPSSA